MPDHIRSLREKIRAEYNCEATHVGHAETQIERLRTPYWRGIVEIFVLSDHPTATICYGWVEKDGRLVTVLSIPPINSPSAAVQKFLANEEGK